jgi:hypothetical protein
MFLLTTDEAIARLEGLGQLKYAVSSLGIVRANFLLVALVSYLLSINVLLIFIYFSDTEEDEL